MTSTKRKDDGEISDRDDQRKMLKKGKDQPGLTTLNTNVLLVQGPDDSSINELFSVLFYSINTFVSDYFKGAPYAQPRKKEQKAFFGSLVGSDCKKYLTSKNRGAKEAIILAAIWNKLTGPLLSAPTKAFVSQIPELSIKAGTKDAKEEFYAWRALTGNFLAKNYKRSASWGEGGDEREEFVDEMASLLLDHSVVKVVAELEAALEGIAEHAFRLATAMATSRACWICSMKGPAVKELHGFKIKTDLMDDVDLWDEDEGNGKSETVDLVKTPMLLKYGNSDGEDYDQYRVFKKAAVVMKANDATA